MLHKIDVMELVGWGVEEQERALLQFDSDDFEAALLGRLGMGWDWG